MALESEPATESGASSSKSRDPVTDVPRLSEREDRWTAEHAPRSRDRKRTSPIARHIEARPIETRPIRVVPTPRDRDTRDQDGNHDQRRSDSHPTPVFNATLVKITPEPSKRQRWASCAILEGPLSGQWGAERC